MRKLTGPAKSRPMCCTPYEETSYATQNARFVGGAQGLGCQNRAQYEVDGKFYCRWHVPKDAKAMIDVGTN